MMSFTRHRTRLKSLVSRRALLGAVALVGAAGLTACSAGIGGSSGAAAGATESGSGGGGGGGTLRLGYFANLTHATALVGVNKGFFQQALGSTTLTTQVFNAGPDEITALLTGSIDAAYVGPSPAINGYVKSHALKIIAGATTGGAELVVKPSITSVSQLKGTTLATPQLGNTQDVALRYFLSKNGYTTSASGGGDVTIEPTANSTTLTLYGEGKLDGAWLPEPYASQLVAEGAHVLVDEKSQWPNGQFTTTDLVVSTSYLTAHPQAVAALLAGQVTTNTWIDAHAADAQTAINAQLKTLTGKALKTSVLSRAWTELAVTNDPLASTMVAEQQHAVAVGLLKSASLSGIYDLTPLNAALAKTGQTSVSANGLGTQ